MNTNTAMLYDFSAAQRAARLVPPARRVDVVNALRRIERCADWLASKDVPMLGFVGSSLYDPVIFVASHPRVWMLFSGRALNPETRRDGALRYDVWQGFDAVNLLTVRWE